MSSPASSEHADAELAPARGGAGRPVVSFEFFPPSEPSAAAGYWSAVHALERWAPRFASVTYGAAGSTRDRTRHCVVELLARTPLAAAPHLTCVGATKAEIADIVRDYWRMGVRHLVVLRGDGLNGERFAPHPHGHENAVGLVTAIREVAPFDISVAAYPETHPEAPSAHADLEHLKRKLDAGAARALTQFFFDADVYLRFRDACVRHGITAPVVPGILPIVNFAQTARFARRCGAAIPARLADRFSGLESDPVTHQRVSAEVAVDLVERLRREGVVEFHVYTLNRSELAVVVCHALGLAGAQEALVRGAC